MATDLTLLLLLSALRRTAGSSSELIRSAEPDQAQLATSADATFPRAPNPRRHSAVCCCMLCEQQGTGEQAMRSVGGDYRRFLAIVGSRVPSAGASGNGQNQAHKPLR